MPKNFNLELPNNLWERFYRAFPGRGVRTSILRKLIQEAVEAAEEGEDWIKILKRRIEEDE